MGGSESVCTDEQYNLLGPAEVGAAAAAAAAVAD